MFHAEDDTAIVQEGHAVARPRKVRDGEGQNYGLRIADYGLLKEMDDRKREKR